MEIMVTITNGELCKLFPIQPIVEMTQPGWKTFSCKRRVNEYCDSEGWKMLEESIQVAHLLYKTCTHQRELQIEMRRYSRLQVLLPWAASIIHYGITGIKN